jgi:membrane protease subunit HflC
MSNRFPILAILGLILATLIYSSIYVVNEREQAVITRFGEITRTVSEPGLYFKLPTNFVESVQIVDDRLLRLDIDDLRVQVSGGKFYVVDAFIVYHIDDLRRFRLNASGIQRIAEDRIKTRLNDALRGVYGLRGFEAALSDERAAMMREVRDLLRPEAENLGLQVVDVRIRRTDLTTEVSQQTYDRMKAERYKVAEFLRARGQEAKSRIIAGAQRQVTEIKAAAQREAEIVRGQGDAERNAIFANAFNRDQEFFDFYRSMAAYRKSLGGQFILSPNSEFMRYFNANGAKSNTNSSAPSSNN